MTIDDWDGSGRVARAVLHWTMVALCLIGPIYVFFMIAGDSAISQSDWVKYLVMFSVFPSILIVYSLASALSAVEPLVVLFIFVFIMGIASLIAGALQEEGDFRNKLIEIGSGFIGSVVGFFSSWATRSRSPRSKP